MINPKMTQDKVLEQYRVATQSLIGFFLDTAEPELADEVNAALKSGVCGMIVEVSPNPLGIVLKMSNGEQQVPLAKLVASISSQH